MGMSRFRKSEHTRFAQFLRLLLCPKTHHHGHRRLLQCGGCRFTVKANFRKVLIAVPPPPLVSSTQVPLLYLERLRRLHHHHHHPRSFQFTPSFLRLRPASYTNFRHPRHQRVCQDYQDAHYHPLVEKTDKYRCLLYNCLETVQVLISLRFKPQDLPARGHPRLMTRSPSKVCWPPIPMQVMRRSPEPLSRHLRGFCLCPLELLHHQGHGW